MHMFLESTTMNDRREQKSQNNWNIGAAAAASASVALLFFPNILFNIIAFSILIHQVLYFLIGMGKFGIP